MDNIRQQLIDRMREKLNTATRNQPSSMAMAVPLGPLADAMLSILADGAEIPTVPRYDANLMVARKWYNTLDQAEIDEGGLFGALSLQRKGGYVEITLDHDAQVVRFKMPPHDAADFGLNIVSAAFADDPAQQAVNEDAVSDAVQGETAADDHPITDVPRLIEGDEGETEAAR